MRQHATARTQIRGLILPFIVLNLSLIAGCGGGGSGGPSTVTIGGTLSGLTGTVVLQNNAGDNLSLSANGPFTFQTPLNTGAAYAISVLKQPPGPSCVVSNGSGAATAVVTSVSVTCTIDPSKTFLPLTATPEQNTSGGATGMFVISSTSLGDQPTQVTADKISSLGFALTYEVSASGSLSGGSPNALLYTTVNSSGGDHVWSLDLSGASSLVPRQVSNLTIPPHTVVLHGQVGTMQYCTRATIPQNLADPSSAFVILSLPTDPTQTDPLKLCGGGPASFQWVLIHSKDGPGQAPVSLPSLAGVFMPLYQPNGALAGIVALDDSHNLNFYPDQTFTNPTRLLANVDYFTSVQAPASSPLSFISGNPGYSFLIVQPLAGFGTNGIYRVDYSGTISARLFDLQGWTNNGAVVDSGSLYFTDTSMTTSGVQQGESVGQIPTGGGAAQILHTYSDNIRRYLMGVSGTHLVFSTSVLTGSTATTGVDTLSIVAPATPTTLATYKDLSSIVLAGGDVFVTLTSGSPYPPQYSTQILDVTGNLLQPETASSLFISYGAPVFQVRGINHAGIGGGDVYVFDLSQPASPTSARLKLPSGMPYSLPFTADSANLQPVTATIGVGYANAGALDSTLLAYDLSKGNIAPIAIMKNTYFQFVTN